MNTAIGAIPEVSRRRLSVAEYHQMGDAGITGAQERVELINGDIIKMTLIGGRQVNLVNWLTRQWVMATGYREIVSVRNPVLLKNDSVPEPDIVVYKPREGYYGCKIPTADRVNQLQPGELLSLVAAPDIKVDLSRLFG